MVRHSLTDRVLDLTVADPPGPRRDYTPDVVVDLVGVFPGHDPQGRRGHEPAVAAGAGGTWVRQIVVVPIQGSHGLNLLQIPDVE